MSADRYRPIGDYAAIGNGRSVALVGSDGAIDWLCLPDIDRDAVFCRLLDHERGGTFRVGPSATCSATRGYVGDTNVLATTFTTGTGVVQLTDLMPAPDAQAAPSVLRLVEGVAGSVDVEVVFRPTFGFAATPTRTHPAAGGAVAVGGGQRLWLTAALTFTPDGADGVRAETTVRAGDRFWVTATYDHDASGVVPVDGDATLAETLAFWERWSARCTYEGPYHPLVRRSALMLKLLAYAPTGAVVAAPTTSLPEEVGGVRNWDYRYTWLRDSALMLYALQSIGYHDEAAAFFGWLERLCLRCRDRLQVMYTAAGGEDLAERTLDHLDGWRGSRPVRVGNAAAGQTQLDVYGEVLDAADLHLDAMPDALATGTWDVLALLADRAAQRWRERDEGIWEVRGEPRHFLYSKLLCWVALDRALQIADTHGAPGDLDRWRRERDAIREAILTTGYDRDVGAFTQALGEPDLDASALAIPLVGFLPPTDPRVRATVARIQERLTVDGLVYRYRSETTPDGLPGSEATFALCSFWLVDNLALAGDIDEARARFERVAGFANDVGLLAEEIDPVSGELLGNFPQGFTHLALIRSALAIAEAESRGPETQAETYTSRLRRTPGTPFTQEDSHAPSPR